MIAGLMVVAAPSRAAAQSPLSGPPNAVPPLTSAPAIKRLDFVTSVGEGYDFTAVADGQPGLIDPRFSQNSAFAIASGALVYLRRNDNVDLSASVAGSGRYFSVVPQLVASDVSGAFNIAAKWTSKISVRASESATYSPYFSFGDFLNAAAVPDLTRPRTEQNIARIESYTVSAASGISWAATRHSAFDAGYSMNYATQPGSVVYGALSYGGNGGWRHQVTRYSDMRIGYGLRRLVVGSLRANINVHDFDTGFSYRRPLSFSRHTTLSLSTGASVVDEARRYSIFATGHVALGHQFSRRWAAAVNYGRDVTAYPGLAQPFLSDVISASLSRALARRISMTASGGYSQGRTAIGVRNGYVTTGASARLNLTLTRRIPFYTEYVYYHSRFERPEGLAPGFPLFVDRHGFRAGLSYSVPLIGRRLPQ